MMPGLVMEEVCDAFVDAFDPASLALMLRFRLNKKLAAIVAGGPLKVMVFDLVNLADQEGWDTDLIREAHRYNPGNASLLQVYEKYGLAPKIAVTEAGKSAAAAPVATKPSSAGLEKILRDDNPALDLALWQARLAELEVRVCRVDVNGAPMGTGFLVGPGAVLTNYHVVKSVFDGQGTAAAVSCLFDYKVLVDGTINPGNRVALQAAAAIAVSSPCTPDELTGHPEKSLPQPDQLDFALLQLARPMGSDPISGPGSPARGWEKLPAAEPQVVPDEGIIIAQHPQGEPMKLAIDTRSVIGLNANRTRVRYRTNTEGGSSGSPVYNLRWNLVALHHLGDPAQLHPPEYNQGVAPLHLIRAKIVADGFGPLLG